MALNLLSSSRIQKADIDAEKARQAAQSQISGYGDPSVPDAQRSVLGDDAWAQQAQPVGTPAAIPLGSQAGSPQQQPAGAQYAPEAPPVPVTPPGVVSATQGAPGAPGAAPGAAAAPPAIPGVAAAPGAALAPLAAPVPLPGPVLLPVPAGNLMPKPIPAGTRYAPSSGGAQQGQRFSADQLNPPHPGGKTINPWGGQPTGRYRASHPEANTEQPIAMPKGGFKPGMRIQDGQMVKMEDGTFARFRQATQSFHPQEFNEATGRFDSSAAIARHNASVKAREEVEQENRKIQRAYDEAVQKQDFEKIRRLEQGQQAIAEIQANPHLDANSKAHAMLQIRLYMQGAASVESISKHMKTKEEAAAEQKEKDLKEQHRQEVLKLREEAMLQKIQHQAEMAELKRQAMADKAAKDEEKSSKGPNTAEYLSIRKELTTVDPKTGAEKRPTHEEVMELWRQIHGEVKDGDGKAGKTADGSSAAGKSESPGAAAPAPAAAGGAAQDEPEQPDVYAVSDKTNPANSKVEFSESFKRKLLAGLGPHAKNAGQGRFVIMPHDRALLAAGKPATGMVYFEVPTGDPQKPKILVEIPLKSLNPAYASRIGLLSE